MVIRRMGIPLPGMLREKGIPDADMAPGDPSPTDEQLLDAVMAHPTPIVATTSGL